MGLGLTFKSLIHCEFNDICGVRKSSLIPACRCPVFPTPFIKGAVFSLVY